MKLFTDSKVVLGYIFNESRCFYVYANNRVQRIRCTTQKHQWHYVQSNLNPADHRTRAISANQLAVSTWLTGPAFLSQPQTCRQVVEAFELIHPESDAELRPDVATCKMYVTPWKCTV